MRLIDADALNLDYEVDMADDWKTAHEIANVVKYAPTVDAVPVIRCEECKYFELNHFENVNGIPLIVAHKICTRWGDGCKTASDGYCFIAERKDDATDRR